MKLKTALLLMLGITAAALAGEVATPPTVTVDTPASGAVISTLTAISGTANDNSGVISGVTFTLREVGIPGSGNRWWNGSAWQETSFSFSAAVNGTSWSADGSFTFPPLNSGRAFVIDAQATDGAGTPSLVVSQSFSSSLATLAWDNGATAAGTVATTQPNVHGGDYYFKVVAQGVAAGGWRTALTVTSGEADVYLLKGGLPTPANNHSGSARTGNDGFVLHSSQFAPAEEWFILVRATAGAQWRLVTGEVNVQNLGTLAADASSGSGAVTIGPEGMKFFRTAIPGNTLAWRLWLNGDGRTMLVKKADIAHPAAYEVSQAAQMLLVPSYLTSGDFYVTVSGAPGDSIDLDSRQQAVADINFISNTSLNVTGYGYTTYRVQVPIQQIAWETTVTPSSGNANLAVRRNEVPNEFFHTAYSQGAGSLTDSITLVPETLSDGTFYITVYGSGPHNFTLTSGNPVITDINYTTQIVNDAPNKIGWRYYRIVDTTQQLGSLGWELFLQNQAPDTELAIRRNAVPGRWVAYAHPFGGSHYDQSDTDGHLQRPGHQADVYYIGVYQGSAALGSFTLNTRPLAAPTVVFNGPGSSVTIVDQPANRWNFFRVDVPADVLGWNLRLKDVSGKPRLVVRRDALPDGLTSTAYFGLHATTWSSGNQFLPYSDWTGFTETAAGLNRDSQLLVATMGYPLEPGTYYVGVSAYSYETGTPLSYTLESRGIGAGQAIQVGDLEYANGATTINGLPEREAAYFRVVIPENTPSWRVRVAPASGDVLLLASKNLPPNLDSGRHYSFGGPAFNARIEKLGREHFVMLPEAGQTSISPGTYYLAVVSQGQNSASPRAGTADSSFTIQSLGALAVTDIGTLGAVGAADLTVGGSLEGGESKAYRLTVPEGTLVMEARMQISAGSPSLVLNSGAGIPAPTRLGQYGAVGGESSQLALPRYDQALLDTLANPTPGTFTFTMKGDRPWNGNEPEDATFTISFRATEPGPVTFDGGSVNVTLQTGGTWQYYRIIVPNDANLKGWDLRLENVTAGNPVVYIRQNLLPTEGQGTTAQADFTDLANDSGNVNVTGRRLILATGSTLQPGVYYVGVKNRSGQADMAYTLTSRGIGSGFTIPVQPLAFTGGSATLNNLNARESAYFKVTIPASTPSWKLKLGATSGESRLLWRAGSLPSLGDYPHTRYLTNPGDEHFVLLPPEGEPFLEAGEYYLAVVSEGVEPAIFPNSLIGSGASSATVESFGVLPVVQLGALGGGGLSQSDTLAYGETRAYEFTVPGGTAAFTFRLTGVTGNPQPRMRAGSLFPSSVYGMDPYGYEGGSTTYISTYNTTTTTVPNPVTTYRIVVKAGLVDLVNRPGAGYTLQIAPQAFSDVTFRSGTANVTAQPAGEWRYFRVTVPAGVDGWDLRLNNVTGGQPQLSVNRDFLPDNSLPEYVATSGTEWPSGRQTVTTTQWSGRTYSASGEYEHGRVLVLGMGQPLEPGTYFVAVENQGNTPTSYTFTSRAIGVGEAIPVNTLDFATGSASISGLAPREIAWHRVSIPANANRWKMRLQADTGESLMVINRDYLPSASDGLVVSKAGNEHFLYLTALYDGLVPGATYFIGVVSEGVNPSAADRIGTGTISATLQSQGQLTITDLGTLGGSDLTQAGSLEGGEVAAYQFTIAPGTVNVEVKLENRTGDPVLVLAGGTSVPNPRTGYFDSYGSRGGGEGGTYHPSLINLVNPVPGTYTLTVRARGSGSTIPDAGYTLRIREPALPSLNFDAAQNSGGGSHTDSASLADAEKRFYRVVIPATLNELPVIGWRLDLNVTQGSPVLRFRKDALPDNSFGGANYTGYPGTTIVAPPVFSPGTWYVEVSATGTTSYQLTSAALTLQRPAWTMPPAGQSPNTPGLTPPFLGDSGVDTGGTPLPGDQGIDLGQGDFHYYAVDVPTGNAGLLRARLDAISGNPDLYVRVDNIPTLDANDRSLTGTGTEYANWVPLNSRFEHQLKPGRWYLAVHAGGQSNVRYRLRLSIGDVQDLALNGGSLANQILAAGDWRYFRVQVPYDAPLNWHVTFSQTVGDVVMHVRDVVPPGNGIYTSGQQDWSSDYKNLGPYGSYDPPGTYNFTTPPLRPGSVYYLGFRAVSDATFSVSSSVSGGTVGNLPTIGFYNTTFNDTVPAESARMYRIDVPANALRWKHTSTHSANLRFSLFAGTIPVVDQIPAWASRETFYPYDPQANAMLNQALYNAPWPWAPAQSFYLVVSNAAASAEAFTFNLDGRNASTEDADEDGLLDAWEIEHFGNIFNYDGNADPDEDGMPNRLEFAAGTNPTSNTSYFPTLNLTAVGGTITASPNQEYFTFNQQVQLTAAPNSGLAFIGWSGDLSGTQNPITLNMNTSKFITASFRVANDNFADREAITGTSAGRNANSSLATKEEGEGFHAGGSGSRSLWWTWTPASSGPVIISTVGSSFDTVLAIYTGEQLNNLTTVTSDDDSGGNGTSLVQFNAVAGTAYQIAVDGWSSSAGGSIVLNLNQTTPPANDNFANRIVLSGATATGNSLTDAATAESGEPIHHNPSSRKTVWWSWTAPAAGTVTISTIGSNFDTVLAIYTGNSLGSLALVTSDDEGGGNNTSRVSFTTAAGITYQIAVDGWSTASGTVVLNVSQAIPIQFSSPTRLGNGHFQFTITGPNGEQYEVRTSTDLINWNTIIQSGTFNGNPVNISDTDAVNHLRRFYRIQRPPAP